MKSNWLSKVKMIFERFSLRYLLWVGLVGCIFPVGGWAFDEAQNPNGRYAVPVAKACVKVLGEAPMSAGDEVYVRQLAIQDALKTASMQRNLQVLSKQETQNFQLMRDQTHYITHSRILGFKILKEGPKPLTDKEKYDQDGNLIKDAKPTIYQVILNVCLTQDHSGCQAFPINPYQVRLAIAQPLVAHPDQARDLKDLVLGVQTEILRRFRQLSYQNVITIPQAPGFQTGRLIEPNLQADVLDGLRAQTAAQFLVLPVIRSTALVKTSGVSESLKHFYLLDSDPNQRHLEMDIYIIDLFDHTLAKQFRVGFDVKGDVVVGRDKPVGTSAFFATDTGKVFHQLLQTVVLRTKAFVKCQPLQAEVIDRRGTDFIVNIPQASGVKVGDQFSVFHHDQAPIRFQSQNLGYDQTVAGFLVVKRVFPDFVVTEVSGKKQPVAIGDRVKAW